jgi:hypothetical protein
LRIAGEVFWKNLYRDGAIEPRVLGGLTSPYSWAVSQGKSSFCRGKRKPPPTARGKGAQPPIKKSSSLPA